MLQCRSDSLTLNTATCTDLPGMSESSPAAMLYPKQHSKCPDVNNTVLFLFEHVDLFTFYI